MFLSFTIPSLAGSLDRSCKEDRTLCPVRAIKYYLDRTERERTAKVQKYLGGTSQRDRAVA